ncbi:energy transducer TonB [Taibaiella koreensis]|uniref:energy transducer TonB n=1 Tax=Taibaiella koreensis TaxID=1268548 RepID=UPI000E59A129|nr:energy transducer TonB [Taibaiella koreensis]
MKYLILILLFGVISPGLHAQQAIVANPVASVSEKERPQYPGGDAALKRYLCLNLRYPNKAIDQKIQGEVVVSFLIDEQGHISDIAATKGIGYGCDEEAIRVVKAMPKWQAGRLNGKPVKMTYNLPVVFELQEDGPEK